LGDYVRYYEIAGITIQVESDLPITDTTFRPKFETFRVDGPGQDTVVIRHHFGIPETLPSWQGPDSGQEVYRKAPWVVSRIAGSWIYHGISADLENPYRYRVAVFNDEHSVGDIYTTDEWTEAWVDGGLDSLTMFPTDQIVIARLLADRSGCVMHSGGISVDGRGLIFVGHSGAGKSTTMELARRRFSGRMKVLCDDRNVLRSWPNGFNEGPAGIYVHGTWSHGDVPQVSSGGDPLRAILFLEQHSTNQITQITDRRHILRLLLPTLVKPLVTADWWERELDLLQSVISEIPCYAMRFDMSGQVLEELEDEVL